MATIWTVGILGAQSTVGGILVHHRVHAAWGNAEEQARAAQLLEVAEVAVPVRLRNDGHAIACCLQRPSNDGGPEGWMVYIGVAREQDNSSNSFFVVGRKSVSLYSPTIHYSLFTINY